MKRYLFLSLCYMIVIGCQTLSAQGSNYNIEGETETVKKYTIMERFEPELIQTASERQKMKTERFAEIQAKMSILDTMDISERKREKLINDLIENPFSTRLSKTLVDTKFSEIE